MGSTAMLRSRSEVRTRLNSCIILGHSADPRMASLRRAWSALEGELPAFEVDYRDWLERRTTALDRAGPGTMLRIDSPGRDPQTYRMLVERGRAAREAEGGRVPSDRELAEFAGSTGALGWPRQWYLGFEDALRELSLRVHVNGWSSSIRPAAVALAFDKAESQRVLEDGAIDQPAWLGAPRSYEELQAMMNRAHCTRVFVKLRHGSAASGIVALRRSRGRIAAWTTVELDGSKVFNTRRIRRLARETEVADVVDAIAPHHLVAQHWVPKAATREGCFDLRLVSVRGRVRHGVVRWSRSPMTNLHLGGRRTGLECLASRLGPSQEAEIRRTVERVSALWGNPLHLGVDVAVTSGFIRHVVLEVNAFGDFLKGVHHRGRTTHEAQLDAMLRESKDYEP